MFTRLFFEARMPRTYRLVSRDFASVKTVSIAPFLLHNYVHEFTYPEAPSMYLDHAALQICIVRAFIPTLSPSQLHRKITLTGILRLPCVIWAIIAAASSCVPLKPAQAEAPCKHRWVEQ